jgi:DNA-binding MarR family transcriptional regulator
MTDQSVKNAKMLYSEGDIRRGVELMYFGYSHLTRSIDAGLSEIGLGRAHHRALYFIARQPDLTVSELLRLLNITKQSLSRVMQDLSSRAFIEIVAGQNDRRQRHLRLTEGGRAMEAELFTQLESKMANAYRTGDNSAISGFWHVLEGLVPEEDRARVTALQRSNRESCA